MKKKVIVLSLGGSLIIPDDVNFRYLRKLKQIILKKTDKYKFIIVCGGGSVARKYISALEKSRASTKLQSLSGIGATRMNARFMTYFFHTEPKLGIPQTTETLEKYLKNQDVVFCGALEYKPKQTSDSTSAELAKHFKTFFINLTDVPGLYNKNPKKYRNAKFIPKVSWLRFEDMANKIKFKPGQHFVLDQTAAKIIRKNKIPTYILGKDLSQLRKLLERKNFKGTKISD